MNIPHLVAMALQADGWVLRQTIIWHKPNPMPESVKDRCTKAHEYVFLLSKSQKYYYDADMIRNQPSGRKDPIRAFGRGVYRQNKSTFALDGAKGANRRSVWTIPTRPFKGAHFAVFPPALVEPCILAGCPDGGTVLDPFTGSGTTGMVALQKGRRFIGCELNKEYAQIAHERIAGGVGPLLMEAMA